MLNSNRHLILSLSCNYCTTCHWLQLAGEFYLSRLPAAPIYRSNEFTDPTALKGGGEVVYIKHPHPTLNLPTEPHMSQPFSPPAWCFYAGGGVGGRGEGAFQLQWFATYSHPPSLCHTSPLLTLWCIWREIFLKMWVLKSISARIQGSVRLHFKARCLLPAFSASASTSASASSQWKFSPKPVDSIEQTFPVSFNRSSLR